MKGEGQERSISRKKTEQPEIRRGNLVGGRRPGGSVPPEGTGVVAYPVHRSCNRTRAIVSELQRLIL